MKFESYLVNDIDICLLGESKTSDYNSVCFFSDLYSLSRCVCVYCLLVLICFETQYSKIICYMKKLLSWPYKRNHFTQSTFYILLEYEMAVFFSELATAGFSILITVKRILMIHLCYLDSMHIHELGSHSLDWRWNRCIWLMMGITCKCYINYFCCRCHCFLSLLNIHGFFVLFCFVFFFSELCVWIWCT